MAGEPTHVRYTAQEEIANCLTHGLGVALSVAGLVILLSVTSTMQTRAFVSCAIYGTTLILLYTSSTLYHSASRPRARQWLRTLDHIAIFLLIAGTYTPFVLIALRGTWGWGLFVLTWSLAAAGMAFELTRLRRYRGAMVVLYIAMGWAGLVALRPLLAAIPVPGLWLLFGGGVSYTFGVLFYRWRSLRYHHAVWHLFVLLGSILQYFSILCYVLPGHA